MPPGWTSTSAAEIVFDAGNRLVSVIRTVPLLVLIGCCASILWMKGRDTRGGPGTLVSDDWSGHLCIEDVEFAGIAQMSVRRTRSAEILRQHLVRRMLEPIAQQK